MKFTLRGLFRIYFLLFFFAGTKAHAELFFDDVLELGPQPPGPVHSFIHVENRGPTVSLVKATADCNCVKITGLPIIISGNSDADIPISIDLSHNIGLIEHRISFEVADKVYFVSILAKVARYKFWSLSKESLEIDARRESAVVLKTHLERTERKEVSAIENILCQQSWLKASFTQNSSGADITYTIGPDEPEGITTLTIVIETNNPFEPLVEQRISVNVPRTVEIDPASRHLAAGAPGSSMPVVIVAKQWDHNFSPLFMMDNIVLKSRRDSVDPDKWTLYLIHGEPGLARKVIKVFTCGVIGSEKTDPILLTELSLMVKTSS